MKRNKLFENTRRHVNTFVIDVDKTGDENREVNLGVGHTLDIHLFGKHWMVERSRRYVRVNKILEEM